jgi:hypothetical protein
MKKYVKQSLECLIASISLSFLGCFLHEHIREPYRFIVDIWSLLACTIFLGLSVGIFISNADDWEEK